MVEDDRETSAGPGRRDPIARGVFRQTQGLRAIAVQGPVALSGIDSGAAIQRGQMGHELDRRFALLAGEELQVREEFLIRKPARGGEDVRLHASHLSRAFF
jgi:hypothetical protein